MSLRTELHQLEQRYAQLVGEGNPADDDEMTQMLEDIMMMRSALN